MKIIQRKFMLTLFVFFTSTGLRIFQLITELTWLQIAIACLTVYAGANIGQKIWGKNVNNTEESSTQDPSSAEK